MKKLLFALLFITGIAQPHVLKADDENGLPMGFSPNVPAPNAATFARYGEIPVDEYTGVPDISIPVYTIKDGDIELPITLSYHAAGNKVEDEASWVGLGWNLEAGGVITRMPMGYADNGAGTFLGWVMDTASATTPAGYTNMWYYVFHNRPEVGAGYIAQNSLDVQNGDWYYIENGFIQPDYFSVTMPGYCGKFFIDNTRQNGRAPTTFHLFNQADLMKIEGVNEVAGYESWALTNKNGVKYIFGYAQTMGSSTFLGSGVPTSWYLTKILYPSGDSVIFKYTEIDTLLSRESYTESKGSYIHYYKRQDPSCDPNMATSCCICDTKSSVFDKPSYNTTSYFPVYLTQIQTKNFTVDFKVSATSREDIVGERQLDAITVHSNSNKTLARNFNFSYGYFVSPAQAEANVYIPVYPGGHLLKRLKLVSFYEAASPTKAYNFTYNSTALPPKNSFSCDYWGYYNGQLNTMMVPNLQKLYRYSGEPNGRPIYEFTSGSANRGADPEAVKAGIISRIKYPTGGYTDFEFEPNQFDNYYYEAATAPGTRPAYSTGAGLRIKSIKNYEANAALLSEKYYTYGYGKIMVAVDFTDYLESNDCNISKTWTTFSGNSASLAATSQGGIVCYQDVTIKDNSTGQNGTVAKTFFNSVQGSQFGWSNAPTQVDPLNGKLSSESYYDKNGNPVKHITYSWVYDVSKDFVSYSAISKKIGSDSPDCIINIDFYKALIYPMVSRYLILQSKITDLYLDGETVETVENFQYNNFVQLTKTTTTSSDGAALVTENYYPNEKRASLPVAANMLAQHVLAPVLEQKKYRDNVPVELTRINYIQMNTPDNTSVFYVPASLDQAKDGVTFSNVKNMTYNSGARLIEEMPAQGPPTSYIWGYNNTLPVAKVENAKAGEIFFDGFEESSGWSKWFTWHTWSTYSVEMVRTGASSLKTVNSTNSEIFFFTPELPVNNTITRKYKASCMVYSKGPSADLFIFYNLTSSPWHYDASENIRVTATNQWTYMEVQIDVPANAKSIFARVDNNSAGTVYFDDVRVQPADSKMTTYYYDPLLHEVRSVTDTRALTTDYEYDELGRLKYIKDFEGNVLQRYEYNYAH